MIAMHFTRIKDPTAYPIYFTENYGAFIQASRFFRANSLEPEQCKGRYKYIRKQGKYVGLPEVKSDVFIIDLRK